jgi:hypothetical protein
MRMRFGAASVFPSILALQTVGCTVDVESAPDRLVIDSESPGDGMSAHLVGTHQAWIELDAHSVRVEDGTGALVASIVIDPSTSLASGSFGGRSFGGDDDWRETAPWQEVAASSTGELVRAAAGAAEGLLAERGDQVELATLASLGDMLDQLSGVDSPPAPQDSCTDYWGCYGWCVGYYYDWYWEPHDQDWACSWYPMLNCDWCPWA